MDKMESATADGQMAAFEKRRATERLPDKGVS